MNKSQNIINRFTTLPKNGVFTITVIEKLNPAFDSSKQTYDGKDYETLTSVDPLVSTIPIGGHSQFDLCINYASNYSHCTINGIEQANKRLQYQPFYVMTVDDGNYKAREIINEAKKCNCNVVIIEGEYLNRSGVLFLGEKNNIKVLFNDDLPI